MVTVTSFHTEKCHPRVSAHEVSAWHLCSCVRQFLIYSTLLVVVLTVIFRISLGSRWGQEPTTTQFANPILLLIFYSIPLQKLGPRGISAALLALSVAHHYVYLYLVLHWCNVHITLILLLFIFVAQSRMALFILSIIFLGYDIDLLLAWYSHLSIFLSVMLCVVAKRYILQKKC